jgi:hypothetical protein
MVLFGAPKWTISTVLQAGEGGLLTTWKQFGTPARNVGSEIPNGDVWRTLEWGLPGKALKTSHYQLFTL